MSTSPRTIWLVNKLDFAASHSSVWWRWFCCLGPIPSALGLLSELRSLAMYSNMLTGSIPSELCVPPLLSTLYVWITGGSPTNPAITCKRSCLSSKNGMSYAPAALPECTSTSISLDTQTALCTFIAATNVTSRHFLWSCNAYGEVVTQPCDGATAVWPGVTCSSNGEVLSIALTSSSLSGKFLFLMICLFSFSGALWSGSIPAAMGLASALQMINLMSNMLTGDEHAADECDCVTNWRLHAYANALDHVGTIPSFLGGLSALSYLNLANNQLMGKPARR